MGKEEFWGWPKTLEQSKEQRKMFIQYGNYSIPLAIILLIAHWAFGLLCFVATFCFYGGAVVNYIHQKLVIEKRETNL